MNDLIIIGAGGQGVEAAWVAADMRNTRGRPCWQVLGFVDDAAEFQGRAIAGRPVLGTVEDFLRQQQGTAVAFHCAVGDNAARKRITAKLEAAGFASATLIAATAIIGPNASIGSGTYIGHHAYVGPESKVGRHVLVNVHVSVGHHSVTDDFVQYCPGVRVSGACRIGEGAFLGSNAVMAPTVKMGAWASLGANAFAIRDIPAGTLAAGAPAQKIR